MQAGELRDVQVALQRAVSDRYVAPLQGGFGNVGHAHALISSWGDAIGRQFKLNNLRLTVSVHHPEITQLTRALQAMGTTVGVLSSSLCQVQGELAGVKGEMSLVKGELFQIKDFLIHRQNLGEMFVGIQEIKNMLRGSRAGLILLSSCFDYMYSHLYICTSVCVRIFVHFRPHVCVRVCVYVCLYTCVHACMLSLCVSLFHFLMCCHTVAGALTDSFSFSLSVCVSLLFSLSFG